MRGGGSSSSNVDLGTQRAEIGDAAVAVVALVDTAVLVEVEQVVVLVGVGAGDAAVARFVRGLGGVLLRHFIGGQSAGQIDRTVHAADVHVVGRLVLDRGLLLPGLVSARRATR